MKTGILRGINSPTIGKVCFGEINNAKIEGYGDYSNIIAKYDEMSDEL